MVKEMSGRIVKGYELRELLGEGGFGAVYRAYQPSIGREVAIKIILPKYANQPNFIRKFDTEAQIIARLEHFHIVPLYDYWREPDGAYFVMRYLRGGTMRDLLKQGALPPDLVIRMVDQMATALMVAHRNNIVHRDLKPDNIMLDTDGNAYLADFGIARLIERDEDLNMTLEQNVMVGSPAYASPEQIQAATISPASDQYSLGIMVYEMLTGVHPYSDSTIHSMLVKHLQEPIPSVRRYIPDFPTDVDMVLATATEKNADYRYPTVQDFADAFRTALANFDMSATWIGERPETTIPPSVTTTPTRRNTIQLTMDWAEVENPFKGLRAFQEADADDFFGRSELIDELLIHFEKPANRFLALVGPSGSGKSSVVKAGVIPALRQGRIPGSENWFVVEMFPGAYPLEELEAALLRVASQSVDGLLETLKENKNGLSRAVRDILPADPGIELVLYIDQFEEMFTFVENEAERAHLLSILLEAVNYEFSRLWVVVSLRADFYDRPLLYPEFGEMFRRNTEVVLPMSDEQLEQAIIGPARRINLQLEPGLVQAIITDVHDQPGALPLLQYALTELFERRTGPHLTLESYTNIGGAMGALARRADDLFVQLTREEKATTKQLFLRLVTLGEGTEDTRRRVMRSELTSLTGNQERMEVIINRFSRYRLLTLDRDAATRAPTVEIAHEALIREWSKLRDWLNTSREDLRMQRRVLNAAEDWARYQRDPSYLARGAQLETFELWAKETGLQLAAIEAEYIQQSVARREEIKAEETQQIAYKESLERRSRTILRALVAVLFTALAIAVGLTIWALGERNIADMNALRADRAAAESRSSGLSAQSKLALLNNDIDLAVTLALEAAEIENPPPISHNILFDIAYHPSTQKLHMSGEESVNAVIAFNDPPAIIYGTNDGKVELWDQTTDAIVVLAEGEGVKVNTIAAPSLGGEILVGSADGSIERYSLRTNERIGQYGITAIEGSNSVTALVYNRNLTNAVVGLQNGELVAIDLNSGDMVTRFGSEASQHQGAVTSIEISPDFRFLVSGSIDRTVRVWDLNSGVQIAVLTDHTAPIRDIIFDPVGRTFLAGAQDGRIILYDASSFNPISTLTQSSATLWSLAFGPDDTIFAGGQDGVLRQWNLTTGEQVQAYLGHSGTILSIAPGQIFGNVVTGSADGTIRVWNFYNNQIVFDVEDTGTTGGGVFALDVYGDRLVSGGAFGSLKLWDLNTGQPLDDINERIVTFNTSFTKVKFIKNGSQIVTGSLDGSVNLWDVTTGMQSVDFGRHRGVIQGMAVNPDETLVATSGRDQTLRIWDIATGEEVARPVDGNENITALAYSPGGDYLLLGTMDGSIIMLTGDSFEQIYRVDRVHTGEITTLVFSSDGSFFASGSVDRTAVVHEANSGKVSGELVGHEDPVLALAFAPGDRELLTASGNAFGSSADASIRLWDVSTGQQLRQFGDEHLSNINAIVYSPDGQSVISADGDSQIIRWQMLDLQELRSYTEQNHYARPLTCGEQSLYDIDQANC